MGRAPCTAIAIAAVGVLATLLASGCATRHDSPPVTVQPPGSFEVPTSQAGPGAYAFHHPGGSVRVGLDVGSLNATLFGPRDERLAAAPLTTTGRDLEAQAPPGELVLVLRERESDGPFLQGPAVEAPGPSLGLSVTTSAGPVTALRRLAVVSGFAVLAQGQDLAGLPLQPVRDIPVNVTLDAVPFGDAQVLVTGTYDSLRVALSSDVGLFATAEDTGSSVGRFDVLQGYRIVPLETTVHQANASGRTLHGTVSFAALDGAVLLTWTSYTRAGGGSAGAVPSGAGTTVAAGGPRSGGDASASASADDASFSYGTLGDGPIHVQVSAAATVLTFRASGDDEPGGSVGAIWGGQDAAVVQAWDGAGHRLGPIAVPVGRTRSLPVHGGEYVLLVLNGTVELGADRAPADVDQHPLQVIESTFPSRRSAPQGRFEERTEPLQVPGIPFDLQPAVLSSGPMPLFCGDDVLLQALQGNATLGSNAAGGWWQAAAHFGDGPLVLHSTGFGDDGCTQDGVTVRSFLLP